MSLTISLLKNMLITDVRENSIIYNFISIYNTMRIGRSSVKLKIFQGLHSVALETVFVLKYV